jgi:hypothetical protein
MRLARGQGVPHRPVQWMRVKSHEISLAALRYKQMFTSFHAMRVNIVFAGHIKNEPDVIALSPDIR